MMAWAFFHQVTMHKICCDTLIGIHFGSWDYLTITWQLASASNAAQYLKHAVVLAVDVVHGLVHLAILVFHLLVNRCFVVPSSAVIVFAWTALKLTPNMLVDNKQTAG